MTEKREWKRLYPVRFRQLGETAAFRRWDRVEFRHGRPKHDTRPESCHVHEESIQVVGRPMPERSRSSFLMPLIRKSALDAMKQGASLALIEPKNTRFYWKEKTAAQIEAERDAYRHAARQTTMFDKQLADLDPSPYEFAFRFEDGDGRHHYRCGDWEVHAMFWNGSRRQSIEETLRWMDGTFNDIYPRAGMIFALGNVAKRPQVWQLLGVIKLKLDQGDLF
ncbi:hypothetical protein C2U72_22395 [Prosthecomicrobium hirschii]|nr:hypothetical protein C2U72_22395 [Prosthecomicrobium hirschii]